MKKIIAMLLCVAMVAAFGVNAFATITLDSMTDVPEIEEYINDKKAVTPAEGIKAYAEALSAAKAVYKAAVKNYNDTIGYVGDAVKAYQYAAVAAYYTAAAELFDAAAQRAINEAVADASIAIEKAYAVPGTSSLGDLFDGAFVIE